MKIITIIKKKSIKKVNTKTTLNKSITKKLDSTQKVNLEKYTS